MRCTTLITLLTGVMLYLGMGALVFVNLEAPEESKAHTTLLKAKQVFLENNSCITEVDFQELKLVSAIEAGLDISSLSPNLTTRWDMGSAFFFCGTIITTIGFGNLSPRTWFGQLFCVCYALVGIPMFGFLLAGVGDHMGTVLRRAVAKIEKLFLKRKIRPTTVRVMSAVLSILIGCLIFLAVPTVVFQKVEKWSFLESLYFVVITLTTVGFGDYVPGANLHPHTSIPSYQPLVLLWIVFGLAYFASILTMIGNWLRVLSKRTRAEKSGSESTSACSQSLAESASFCPHPHTPELHPPSPQGSAASSPDCQLLDFFGETLAYIDESSDTLSDLTEPTASKEKRRRPHKPKRRSMKKGLSPGWSLLHLRRPSLQPPSNPPTPPPDCSSSDLSVSEIQTDSNPGL
uniref:Potassium channel, subfamily K, member 4a n=1 Tax=Cyprinodon variegatus TaxID=28743 RepID=A0A3Q2FKX7_CYPVA